MISGTHDEQDVIFDSQIIEQPCPRTGIAIKRSRSISKRQVDDAHPRGCGRIIAISFKHAEDSPVNQVYGERARRYGLPISVLRIGFQDWPDVQRAK
jgi:hypothetical protein